MLRSSRVAGVNVGFGKGNEMAQISEEQREHFDAVARSATAKLEAFRDGLTADERAILSVALWQAMTETATDEEVVGFAMNSPWGHLGRIVVDGLIFEGVKAAWEWMTENASDKVSERPLTPGRINY